MNNQPIFNATSVLKGNKEKSKTKAEVYKNNISKDVRGWRRRKCQRSSLSLSHCMNSHGPQQNVCVTRVLLQSVNCCLSKGDMRLTHPLNHRAGMQKHQTQKTPVSSFPVSSHDLNHKYEVDGRDLIDGLTASIGNMQRRQSSLLLAK